MFNFEHDPHSVKVSVVLQFNKLLSIYTCSKPPVVCRVAGMLEAVPANGRVTLGPMASPSQGSHSVQLTYSVGLLNYDKNHTVILVNTMIMIN